MGEDNCLNKLYCYSRLHLLCIIFLVFLFLNKCWTIFPSISTVKIININTWLEPSQFHKPQTAFSCAFQAHIFFVKLESVIKIKNKWMFNLHSPLTSIFCHMVFSKTHTSLKDFFKLTFNVLFMIGNGYIGCIRKERNNQFVNEAESKNFFSYTKD